MLELEVTTALTMNRNFEQEETEETEVAAHGHGKTLLSLFALLAPVELLSRSASESGVALRLPPHSKTWWSCGWFSGSMHEISCVFRAGLNTNLSVHYPSRILRSQKTTSNKEGVP
ncbi:MAG: hypothetical protein JWQ04_379 [Pedosphaera sp.]|nr:hypothetical protein [Pedosphaera sp.]